MDLLVDTHVLAWLANDNKRLSKAFVEALNDPDTRLFVSAVTAYEYADLVVRWRLPSTVGVDVWAETFGIILLDFPAELWRAAASLPDIHRDPVDRMLIAHAMALGMTLVTADENMARYPVKTL